MHARSRDGCVISLIYVRVKVAHGWKLKAGFRACSLPQSSACWMWPPFWLDVWSPVRVCVYMRPGCFSACQQLKWYMAEAAFLPPSECQPAVHVHAMQEADTPNTRRSWSVTVWALPKSFWLLTDPQQHPEDWKTKQKALQLPYFFFYLLKISFPFLTVYICNELTLRYSDYWMN